MLFAVLFNFILGELNLFLFLMDFHLKQNEPLRTSANSYYNYKQIIQLINNKLITI